jgi:hypothetical protein
MDTTIVLALLVLLAIICTDLVFRSVAVNSNRKGIYTFYFYSSVFSLGFALTLNLILLKKVLALGLAVLSIILIA